MSLTYFRTEDAIVTISDEGYARLTSEQRINHATSIHTAIFIGSALGLVATFGLLVLKHKLGMS